MDPNFQNMNKEAILTFETFGDQPFLKISNLETMRPFFMSIVSDSDHWMFISSNGGLSAGRKNAENALFPYYTDDKITEFADITGSKTIFQLHGSEQIIWEPFSNRNLSSLKRKSNIYKSIYGNIIVFEEILVDYQLIFRYAWTSSDQFGFVKTSTIINNGTQIQDITLLDGIQNIMPCGVPSDLQNNASNLVDAYKRSELDAESGLGLFALSAIISDKAEPSEALKANVVWSTGLAADAYLLSSKQLAKFRSGNVVHNETDVKGEKGAYFISKKLHLKPAETQDWRIIADVNKTHSQVFELIKTIQTDRDISAKIQSDIYKGTQNLKQLVASADGIQRSNDLLQDARNFANVMFNIMRGGIFDDVYQVDRSDFEKYLKKANRVVYDRSEAFLQALGTSVDYVTLTQKAKDTNDADFIRLAIEYLPLKFSRRHGDPSRPWNKFSINLKDENSGDKILDYQGNWRDIFQNWEALAYSYPEYIDGMIFKFLNASTFDGYNPYRVTKGGFDWETIEPDDPWSYIGYWGDHQIIYLQKFLEIIQKFKPSGLEAYFDQDYFVYAAVPYIIKPYEDIVNNPKDTIEFDHHWDARIRENMATTGADGALLTDNDHGIYRVNLIEKLLATLLAKMSNFIPEAGIWLNTQRPEWNDANNALVGNGVSMVTLYYMRRFLVFLDQAFGKSDLENIKLSNELIEFYHSVRETLDTNQGLLSGNISAADRKMILDQLGKAASDYRSQIYKSGFWGKKRTASMEGLRRFVKLSLAFINHSIEQNKRKDGLYHAYNLMTYKSDGVMISYLDEMLEGQVAVLSSGYLDSKESLDVLDAMKHSKLFREDQYSYILYPNKKLPGFLSKNIIDESEATSSALIQSMVANGNKAIVEKDVYGQYHFNGNFKNAGDLKKALENIADSNYSDLIKNETPKLFDIFEKVFNHKAFTGRSGTFYGYEGLGSIYWHMVSKLLLAVQECILNAVVRSENPVVIGRLVDHYFEIKAGIGVHKSPSLYGAFPTDPYSHTPMYRGAQQPGMTGQVKEDILTKYGEFGIQIHNGKLKFNPSILRKTEFLVMSAEVTYFDFNGNEIKLALEVGQLFFTFCRVPIVYQIAHKSSIELVLTNGENIEIASNELSTEWSKSVFTANGSIQKINVLIAESSLLN